MNKPPHSVFSHLENDLPAGLVVFLVALPLCLGIALASGAPLFSGIITGVVGGMVVGALSGSHTSVSGPAAGLTVIIAGAIAELGSFEIVLSAILLAGAFQFVLGLAKAGVIGYFFPTAVIKGMLAGIGMILILKQLPYALGLNHGGDIVRLIPFINEKPVGIDFYPVTQTLAWGALVITTVSMGILILWGKAFVKTNRFLRLLPGPLVVVVAGIALNQLFHAFLPDLYLADTRREVLPVIQSWDGFKGHLIFPDFSKILHADLWMTAATIAVIASLESLLSLEAADKIDPFKRISPPNRELLAQGVCNMVNGLVGGLPATAVIVRSSANVTSGARTKMAAIFHGLLLLGSVFFIPKLLNLIPLASLAAILLQVGYKLTRVSLFKKQVKLGWGQFLPFIVTLLGIVAFDLLIGIGMGMGVAVVHILLRNMQYSHCLEEYVRDNGETIKITLSEDVSFLNKGALTKALDEIPDGKHVILDGSVSKAIDYDVLEVIDNFKINAATRGIQVETLNIPATATFGLKTRPEIRPSS